MRIWRTSGLAVAIASSFYAQQAGACGGFLDTFCNIGEVGKKAAGDVSNTINKGLDDVAREGNKAINDAGSTLDKAGKDTVSTIKKAYDDAIINLRKTISDGSNTINKAFDDTVRTYAKAINDIIDAEKATVRFVENEVQGIPNTLKDAEKRAREGKIVDALWHLHTDNLKKTSENAALAAKESDVINAAGQAAASFYGGPAGSAAYAAWYAYQNTKDINLALKAGVIAGAKSYGQNVADMPGGTIGAVMKKSVATGAIGGLTVAIAGGDGEAVKNSFIKSGSMVIIQYGKSYVDENYVQQYSARLDNFCMAAVDNNCPYSLPELKKDINGIILKDIENNPLINNDRIITIRENIGHWDNISLDRIRQSEINFTRSNVIPIGDGSWLASFDRNAFMDRSANLPAITLTNVGPGTAVAEKIDELKKALSQAEERERQIRIALSEDKNRIRPPSTTWVALGDLSTGSSYFRRLEPASKRGDAGPGDILEATRDLRLRPSPGSTDIIDNLIIGEKVVVIDVELTSGNDGVSRRWAKIASLEDTSSDKPVVDLKPPPLSPLIMPSEPNPLQIKISPPPTFWCVDKIDKQAFEISPSLNIRGLTMSAIGKARKRKGRTLEIFISEDISLIPDLIQWPINSTSILSADGKLMKYDQSKRLVEVGRCKPVSDKSN